MLQFIGEKIKRKNPKILNYCLISIKNKTKNNFCLLFLSSLHSYTWKQLVSAGRIEYNELVKLFVFLLSITAEPDAHFAMELSYFLTKQLKDVQYSLQFEGYLVF